MRTLPTLLIGLMLTGCSAGLVSSANPPAEYAQDVTDAPQEQAPEAPPADPVPAEEPVEEPPAEEPPAEEPPAEEPPAEEPPAEEPPAEEPTTQPPPPVEPLECGANAAEVSGACVCDTDYTVCDAADLSAGCCAYGANTFAVSFVRAEVLPYEDPTDESPWDWSGFVPGWMRDLIGAVAVYVDDSAAEWLDVIDYVSDFAPELLEGSTPPDPFIEVVIDNDIVYSTDADANTIEPVWNETATFVLGSNDDLTLWFMDEDLDFDDDMGGVYFTQTRLQELAGRGEQTFDGTAGVHAFTIEVEPIF